MTQQDAPRVALFVTCLADMFRPQVGFAAAKLLEQAGCKVEVPLQSCCGQPAYNSGDRASARALARKALDEFEGFDYVVVPSGSCGGMIRTHFPDLFRDAPAERERVRRLCERTYELTDFLANVAKPKSLPASFAGTVTYHDSCSGLRELKVKEQPRKLLATVEGLGFKELPSAEICCGFGGTFCVKYPDISERMAKEKADDVAATGADTLLAGDMGCLMNMAGKLQRQGSPVRVRHVAEVLAGMTDAPPIGEPEKR